MRSPALPAHLQEQYIVKKEGFYMSAAPFKAIVKCVAQNGQTFSYPITVSDVNGEYYVFPDGNNDVVLPSDKGVISIVDIVLSAAGTDTSKADIYVNGKTTGEQILNSANLGTNFSRQLMGAPMRIAAGARVRFKQLT
jgi:hypothetical protein